jgi:virginiamycin A acetyltransferase
MNSIRKYTASAFQGTRSWLSRSLEEYERSAFNRRTANRICSPGVSLEAIDGQHITALPGTFIDKHCSIGSYAWFGYNCFVTKARVGRYTGIGNNVSIGPGEHRLDRIANNATLYDEQDIYEVLTEEPCTIGPDVWIGVDSVIRRGTEIGAGAVVGANSFVNESVPPYAIVAGTPAKIIRYRFGPAQIAAILESRWWELEIIDARLLLRELATTMQGTC